MPPCEQGSLLADSISYRAAISQAFVTGFTKCGKIICKFHTQFAQAVAGSLCLVGELPRQG